MNDHLSYPINHEHIALMRDHWLSESMGLHLDVSFESFAQALSQTLHLSGRLWTDVVIPSHVDPQGVFEITTQEGPVYWTHQHQIERQWLKEWDHSKSSSIWITPKSYHKLCLQDTHSQEHHGLMTCVRLLEKQGLGMCFKVVDLKKYDVTRVADVLVSMDCPLSVARHMAQALEQDGVRVTTTRYALKVRWQEIIQALSQYGVEVIQTPPRCKMRPLPEQEEVSQDLWKDKIKALARQFGH